MFVHPNARGKGVASKIIQELETWAQELGATRVVLETGKRMQDAVSFYKKLGYTGTQNYGPYKGIDTSFCFEKLIH